MLFFLKKFWLYVCLVINTIVFFIEVGLAYLLDQKYVLGTLFVILLTGTYVWFSSQLLLPATKTVLTPPPLHQEYFTQSYLTESEINQKITVLTKLLETQTEHVDILINIALLNRARGDQSQYDHYWNRAKEVDPNNKVFLVSDQ